MKWPFVEKIQDETNRMIRVSYVNKVIEIGYDESKCKVCRQCTKACPHGLWQMPVIEKGKKVPLTKRMPIMPDAQSCAFCGLCMVLCPFDAIIMKENGSLISKDNLTIVKEGVVPNITLLKTGKIEAEESHSRLWEKALDRVIIQPKSKV